MKVRKNNAGFTLIEMMVAMSILSIILLGVAWMMAQMSESFSNSQKEVQLQDNVQATYSVVSGLVKEAQSVKKGIDGKYNSIISEGNRLYIFSEEVDRDLSGMYLQVPEVDSGELHIVEFVPSENRLYLYSQEYNPRDYVSGSSGSYTFDSTKFESDIKGIPTATVVNRNNLLSNNVKSFEVVDRTDRGYVILSLELEYGRRQASITQNVYLRNSNISVQDSSAPTNAPTDAPTDTPTPPPAGSGFTLTSQGNMSNPTKDTISTHADIKVNYESGYEMVEQEVPVYKLLCPNGHELSLVQEQNWLSPVVYLYNCTDYSCQYSSWGNLSVTAGQPNPYEVATGETQVVQVPTGNSGTLEIKNTSLTSDYIGVEITLYFEATDALFAPISGTNLLKVNSESTGTQACTYYSSTPDGSGRCQYIKICIPELKKAETYTENGEDKVRYDKYVIDYSWYTASGNRPVMCSYSIAAY